MRSINKNDTVIVYSEIQSMTVGPTEYCGLTSRMKKVTIQYVDTNKRNIMMMDDLHVGLSVTSAAL